MKLKEKLIHHQKEKKHFSLAALNKSGPVLSFLYIFFCINLCFVVHRTPPPKIHTHPPSVFYIPTPTYLDLWGSTYWRIQSRTNWSGWNVNFSIRTKKVLNKMSSEKWKMSFRNVLKPLLKQLYNNKFKEKKKNVKIVNRKRLYFQVIVHNPTKENDWTYLKNISSSPSTSFIHCLLRPSPANTGWKTVHPAQVATPSQGSWAKYI